MKFYNLVLFSLLIINLVFANPIKKKCIVKNKDGNKNGSNDNNDSTEMNQYEIDHINAIDKYLGECTVLLRKNGDFPFGEKVKEIYLYGNGVRKTIKGGTGSGDVNSRHFDTVEEAFTKAGFKIMTTDYLDAYDKIYADAKAEYKKKLQSDPNVMANPMSLMGAVMPEPEYDISYEKEGDIALYVLSRISGEGTDRTPTKGDVYLTDTETKIILDLAKGFKKFMLVLNTGGPVDLSGLEDVKNILILSQLGVNTSNALVDIVVGKKYPSGKLATTWTKFEDYQTIGDFGDNEDTNYKEGIYVGYRYFDTENVDVMFPFGFGLGYTDFEYEVKSAKLNGEKFEVTVSVKNIGQFKGKEVMELYLSKPNTTLDEPYQVLTATYILDKGSYIVRVGNSSRNTTPCGEIKVKSKINVKKVANKMGKPEFEDYVPEAERKEDDLSKVKKFTLNPKYIKEQVVDYDQEFEISEEVKKLTDEEKAKLVIGAYQDGPASVVGSASISAAGAAGETHRVAGLEPVVMADGPAGLRLAKDYFIDEYGAHNTAGSMPESMIEYLPDEMKSAFLNIPEIPEGTEIKHQYTTAIPIGTAIAQSWNKKFAEICGDVGVQKHNRRYVTIKHYAANNQETNRYGNNGHVSERALREIYLKGFEICVKEASPKAVMTSYNLINGVHTNESKDLTTDILRIEFGHKGIVMTDWIVGLGGGKYPSETSNGVIKAGGDIFMPGNKNDFENILNALKNDSLTMEELEISASRIYNLAKDTKH
eukprot:jgi/Orpsp1_1/1175293/evm.model.c7180000053313.1